MSRYGVTPNVSACSNPRRLVEPAPLDTLASVSAQMLVIPPQLALYMALAPEEKLTYEKAGPAGQAAFESGVAGFEAKAFRGCGVVTSEPYEVSDDQDSVQMCAAPLAHAPPLAHARTRSRPLRPRRLTRSTQIGEFYVMMPPQIAPTGNDGSDNKHTCDLLIYDEESDKHVRICLLYTSPSPRD